MFLSLAALVLQGCAVTTQDTSLARRTAHTLGADPDQITISKVDKGLQRIDALEKGGVAKPQPPVSAPLQPLPSN